MTTNRLTADAVLKNSKTEQSTVEDCVQNNKRDIFNLERLKLSQNFSTAVEVKKRLTVIQVRKPNKQEFIRVHPNQDYCIQTFVLEFKEDAETYLVDPGLWHDLAGELIPKMLYTTINRQGVLRLWPIRLPDEEGKLDDWNQSALESAEIAKSSWVRVSSNRNAGMYETLEAMGKLDDPEWPEMPFAEILKIAFKSKYIEDWNHPALRKLRGDA